MILTNEQLEHILNTDGFDAPLIRMVNDTSSFETLNDAREHFKDKMPDYFYTWEDTKDFLIETCEMTADCKIPKDFTYNEFISKGYYEWTETGIDIQEIDGKNAWFIVFYADFI